MGNDTRGLPSDTVERLASRLAAQSGLRLPAQLRQQANGPTAADKQRYLQQLLIHDPGVFLERHGSELTEAELAHFRPLRGDYEVDFYCKELEDRTDKLKRSQVAKNRRLAYMARLEAAGTYFGEEAMRDRQPALHAHYIGQYQSSGTTQGALTHADEAGCQAGNALAQSILRGQEELELRQRQEAEQQRWDQVEEESEEEEEEEEQQQGRGAQLSAAAHPQQQNTVGQSKPGAGNLPAAAGARGQQAPAAAAAGSSPQVQQAQREREQQGEEGAGEEGAAVATACVPSIPEDEAQENAATFLDLMRQRFLGGLDGGVDYAAIDADQELDDHWAKEAGRDAEDKYFSDD